MRVKFRVIQDVFGRYVVQKKSIFWPFWYFLKYTPSEEEAKRGVDWIKSPPILETPWLWL